MSSESERELQGQLNRLSGTITFSNSLCVYTFDEIQLSYMYTIFKNVFPFCRSLPESLIFF